MEKSEKKREIAWGKFVFKLDRGLILKSFLTFRRRIKSRLPFTGIIRRLTYSTRFQDKG